MTRAVCVLVLAFAVVSFSKPSSDEVVPESTLTQGFFSDVENWFEKEFNEAEDAANHAAAPRPPPTHDPHCWDELEFKIEEEVYEKLKESPLTTLSALTTTACAPALSIKALNAFSVRAGCA